MTDAPSRLSDRAAELRLAFDRSFAAPPRLDTVSEGDFLGIRLAGNPYAIRLSDIAGLFADKAITRVPNSVPSLIGIAGFRGAIVPVYSLELLLGHSVGGTPRWMTIAAHVSVAFAFEGFDGHLRLSRDAILPQENLESDRRFTREFARTGGIVRPVVDLPSVVDAIRKPPQGAALTRER